MVIHDVYDNVSGRWIDKMKCIVDRLNDATDNR